MIVIQLRRRYHAGQPLPPSDRALLLNRVALVGYRARFDPK
jgi:hypothetical protein